MKDGTVQDGIRIYGVQHQKIPQPTHIPVHMYDAYDIKSYMHHPPSNTHDANSKCVFPPSISQNLNPNPCPDPRPPLIYPASYVPLSLSLRVVLIFAASAR